MGPVVTAEVHGTGSGSDLALTDDEVLGLVALAGARWRTVTPTVDVGDAAELVAATGRGVRSLAVRGLAGGTDDEFTVDPSLESVLSAAVHGDLLVASYACDLDLGFRPDGPTLGFFRAGGGGVLVVDTVSGMGVHQFGMSSEERCREVIGFAVDVAPADVERARPETTDTSEVPPPAFCVMLVGGEPADARLFRFTGSQVLATTLTVLREASSPADALQPTTRLAFDVALGRALLDWGG